MIVHKYEMYDYCDLLHFAVENKIATWNEAINILRPYTPFDDDNDCYIEKGEAEGKAGQIIDGYLNLIGLEEARIIYT